MSAYAHELGTPLGPQQRALLDFIKAEVAAGRPFPSVAAIAERFGWPTAESKVRLGTLIWRGHVKATTTYEMTTIKGWTRRVGTRVYELVEAPQ